MKESRKVTRRQIIRSAAGALLLGAVPGISANPISIPGPGGRKKILVTIFQRFGMDGLLAVAPYGNSSLAALRPNLMLSPPGSGRADSRLDLGEGFGLHPSLADLLPFYQEGRLAIVHGVGSPDSTRAHGRAQMWWETGAPGNATYRDGWMYRLSRSLDRGNALLPAVSMTEKRPRIFYGHDPITAQADLQLLGFAAGQADGNLAAMEALYKEHRGGRLSNAVSASLELSRILGAQPTTAVTYPEGSSLAASLRDIARLIKADVGLQLAFAESRTSPDGKGTWDTHSNAASMDGPFPRMAEDLARSLAAFMADLGHRRDDVTVVTLTDFGRNVVENARLGADHGRATAMFVLGSDVKGGRIYGDLPDEFSREMLEDGLDLPVSTDYRAVLSAQVQSQFGIADASGCFPGWQGGALPLFRA